jgi:hypothetical protein
MVLRTGGRRMTEVWRNIWFDEVDEFDDLGTFGLDVWNLRVHYDGRMMVDDEWMEVRIICLVCGNSVSSCVC